MDAFKKNAINTLNIISPVVGGAVTATSNKDSPFGEIGDVGGFSNIIGTIIFFVAMYLAFKCKTYNGGLDPIQLLLAFCCSPCYVVYRLAVPCG